MYICSLWTGSFKRLTTFWPEITVYILGHSNLLVSVVYFAQPDKTSLWAVWAEQHAQDTSFLP